jgi:hypothetical protein
VKFGDGFRKECGLEKRVGTWNKYSKPSYDGKNSSLKIIILFALEYVELTFQVNIILCHMLSSVISKKTLT